MKPLFTLVVFLITSCNLLSQDINKINTVYSTAVKKWVKSSHEAYPHFEELYLLIQPLYNKYPNHIELPGELHKMSRNYVRFMYEFTIKFGDERGIHNGWKLSQYIKSFDALKAYNTTLFQNPHFRRTGLLGDIYATDTYVYDELRGIDQKIKNKLPDNDLFLEVPTIKDLQKKLKSDEVYVSFSFSLNERSFFFLKITRNDQRVFKSKMHSFELINRIALVKGLLENDEDLITTASVNLAYFKIPVVRDIPANLKKIQHEIIDKLNLAPGNKLIIENDIFISQIPFDIIKNSKTNRYLIQDNDISYVPNAEYFMKVRALAKNPDFNTILGMSGSNVEEDEIEGEITLIQDYFSSSNADILLQTDKNKCLTNLRQLKWYDIIHISSHFRKNEIPKAKSGPVVIDGYTFYPLDNPNKEFYFEFRNSKVFPQDILKENNLKTNLLILSGCETGTSDYVFDVIKPYAVGMGDVTSHMESGQAKLGASFLTLLNGGCYCNKTESFSNLSIISLPFKAKYVIAFQNAIDPRSSEQFFRQFYEYLHKYNDVKKAFRATKLDFLNRLEDNIYDHFLIILISD